MLHNHMLRDAGQHTVGESESDWEGACTHADDIRIREQQGTGGDAPALTPHVVDDAAVGNETEQEVEGGHSELHNALVAHYTMQLADGLVMWPKSVQQLRGRPDRRKREAGGGKRARQEDEVRHALVSESDESDAESESDFVGDDGSDGDA